MNEELRVFLRTIVYIVPIGVIYWFVSYEIAGTALLAALAIAVTLLVVVALRLGRTLPLSFAPKELLGFEESHETEPPFEIAEDLFPSRSLWPIALAAGISAVALGLEFGAWLWGPGAAVAVAAGLAWFTQLHR